MQNDDLIDAYLQSMHSYAHFMGAILIENHGKSIFCKGYGEAKANVKNTPSTVFQIASLTKQFTAAAIMKLYEQKTIRLEHSINDYLPSCFRCRNWNSVEVRHLLSHQSGIPNYTDWDDYWDICKRLTPEKIIKEIREEELDFSPGTDCCYSNTGYDLLGKIIEEVSGTSYEEFLTQNILIPAGMKNSGIRKPHDHPVPQAAVGYYLEELEIVEDPRDEFSVLFADGAMFSTVGDLALWSSVLDGNSSVLSPESIKLMLSKEYGLMADKLFGRKRIHHSGSMAGFRSDFCKFPQEELTIIILGNNADFVPEYLSAKLASFFFQHQPLPRVIPFPKDFNFDPYLTTFYWDEEEDDNYDDESDYDEDDEDEVTFAFHRKHFILEGDKPTECCLLTNGRLFNACEGEEFDLQKDGGILLFNSDGEEEGILYPD